MMEEQVLGSPPRVPIQLMRTFFFDVSLTLLPSTGEGLCFALRNKNIVKSGRKKKGETRHMVDVERIRDVKRRFRQISFYRCDAL
jgi:hypothetical protein